MIQSKKYMGCMIFVIVGLFFGLSDLCAQGVFRERAKERKQAQGESKDAPGDYDFSLEHDGITRKYKVHVPGSYMKTAQTPLILAFHGGGGSNETMSNDKYYGLISKSDKEGFIVAFPNGASQLRSGKFATWNAGNCCGYARDQQVDDVGFVIKVIADIETKFNVDPKKIYAVGMSNGGMFSYRLACDLTDQFRAIASVAGTDNCGQCRPTKPISIMHIHAKDDDHVLFGGGYGLKAFKDPSKVTDFTSVPETVSRWVERNHCNKEPQRVMTKEGVYCDLYTGCDNNVEIKLCVTETGGHSWPGSKRTARKGGTGPSQAMSAVDEIWDFFNKA